MRKTTLLSLLASLCLLSTVAFAQSEDEKFDKLTQDFLKGYFMASPIGATYIGVHDYDNVLDDVSAAAVDAEVKRLSTFKQNLASINAKALSKAKNIDQRILVENIDESLFSYNELKEYTWNPMVYTGALGNSMAGLLYQEFAPIDQRLKNAVERAKQVPRYLKQAEANLSNAPKMHVETAIKQNQGNI